MTILYNTSFVETVYCILGKKNAKINGWWDDVKEYVFFFLFLYILVQESGLLIKIKGLNYETRFTCLHKYIRIHNSN